MSAAEKPSDRVRVESPTEHVNPNTVDLDLAETGDMVRLIQAEDRRVFDAVSAVGQLIAALVDVATDRVRAGGRVHYFGAGTSGRLAVLDAAELPPTYGVSREVVVAHQAGGDDALVRTVEGAEDDESAGRDDAAVVTGADVVLGLAASGRTPWVRGALDHARSVGAYTAVVTANPAASLVDVADLLIVTDTGPEVITGSTRMKAGTALKLVLNTFSTALMVRLGHTYSNLMVDVVASNGKLRGRAQELLQLASGASPDQAAAALRLTTDLKTALTAVLVDADPDRAGIDRASQALAASGRDVRTAVDRLRR